MTGALVRLAPWLALGLGLILATLPTWRVVVFGFTPTLDELLSMVCRGPRP